MRVTMNWIESVEMKVGFVFYEKMFKGKLDSFKMEEQVRCTKKGLCLNDILRLPNTSFGVNVFVAFFLSEQDRRLIYVIYSKTLEAFQSTVSRQAKETHGLLWRAVPNRIFYAI